VPLVLTAFGTAGIVGGAWMIANGSRRRRDVVRMPPEPMPKPIEKPADKPWNGERGE
jgi:hypothetical protein